MLAARRARARPARSFRFRCIALGAVTARRFRRRLFLFFLGGRFGTFILEISCVPARALQMKTRRTHQLAELGFSALRAIFERSVAQALQELLLMPARSATIFVDRHGLSHAKKQYILTAYKPPRHISGLLRGLQGQPVPYSVRTDERATSHPHIRRSRPANLRLVRAIRAASG